MKRIRVVALGMAALLSPGPLSAHARAQVVSQQATPAAATEQPGWFDVPQTPRQKIDVLTIDGNWHKGRLRLATSEAIIFDSGPPIRRDDVWQVWADGKPSWAKRGFGMGLAIGLAIGIAAYAGQGDCADPTSVCAREGEFGAGAMVAGGLVIGAAGAILGRLIGGPARQPGLAYMGPTRLKQATRMTDERR